MTDARVSRPPPSRALIRSVALPAEHGGWGFLLEPMALGLLTAASGWGVLLIVSAFGVFLTHQPLKLAAKDYFKRRRVPRTVWAERFAAGYLALAVIPFGLIMVGVPPSTRSDTLVPLLAAAPFAMVQLLFEARNRNRALTAELAGAFSLGALAPAMAVLASWSLTSALVLWLIQAVRAVTSILYVRARLRLEYGQIVDPRPVWALHILAVVALLALATGKLTPWLAAAGAALLAGRALIGLSALRKPRRAPQVGIMEMVWGLLNAALAAVGLVHGL